MISVYILAKVCLNKKKSQNLSSKLNLFINLKKFLNSYLLIERQSYMPISNFIFVAFSKTSIRCNIVSSFFLSIFIFYKFDTHSFFCFFFFCCLFQIFQVEETCVSFYFFLWNNWSVFVLKNKLYKKKEICILKFKLCLFF